MIRTVFLSGRRPQPVPSIVTGQAAFRDGPEYPAFLEPLRTRPLQRPQLAVLNQALRARRIGEDTIDLAAHHVRQACGIAAIRTFMHLDCLTISE